MVAAFAYVVIIISGDKFPVKRLALLKKRPYSKYLFVFSPNAGKCGPE